MTKSIESVRKIKHHAFVVEAETEKGIEAVQEWSEKELGMKVKGNPDVVILRYGLFSVTDARRVFELASSAPFISEYKIFIIAAGRVYHEAQNVLLKLFEEPPPKTFLFLVLPSLGSLLPTLRSRVQIFDHIHEKIEISETAREFLKAGKEKRSQMIKKLASGDYEDERRRHRDEAISIMNGVEAVILQKGLEKYKVILSDISQLRDYLYDRSAPVKMILEHLSIITPKGLL